MPTRASLWIMAAAFLGLASCMARHAPWELRGRPPCADEVERVERDEARIAALEASGSRPDELIWFRDDHMKAERALGRCKASLPDAKAKKSD